MNQATTNNGILEKNTLYYLDCRDSCYARFFFYLSFSPLLHSRVRNQGFTSSSNLGRASGDGSCFRTDYLRSDLGN